jgi:hypothetical protein
MGDRYKFTCGCGQRIVAERRLAGLRMHCPACKRRIVVPATGQAIDEKLYEKVERYALVCVCQYRVLVKAAAAGQTIHCPVCRSALPVPQLDVLRRGSARALVVRPAARSRVGTEELLVLVDDRGESDSDLK